MTLTILASVSLLALVSSARPLPDPDDSWSSLQITGSGEDGNVQQVVQALVKSHAGLPDELKEEEDVHVQLASPDEVQAYLSTADGETIKALIPLDENELHSPDEKELYELLNRLEDERGSRSPVPDEALDSMTVTSGSGASQSVELSSEISSTKSDLSTPEITKPVVIMAVSCAVALLAVCCVAAVLYLAETLCKSVFRSAWSILPQLEKNAISHRDRNLLTAHGIIGLQSESEKMPGAFVLPRTITVSRSLHRTPSRASLHGVASDGSDFGDDGDEKFFDAESTNWDVSPHGSPRSAPTELPPGLPALAAATATVAAVAVMSPSEMREVPKLDPESDSSPIVTASPRPPWSVRATEAGALMHAHGNQNSDEQRRRGGMFAMPQLDAALAMQLRPGLGIGADAAWLVRFVMALFGWCAVLMSGGRG